MSGAYLLHLMYYGGDVRHMVKVMMMVMMMVMMTMIIIITTGLIFAVESHVLYGGVFS